ncbi:hypothetical protein [Ferrimonas marina]|uniref:Uncharacterized protein n=1 Tax=Ferrimonas marina TaxID=299255 RepID=A0A1M5UBE9_9GAMM|nr:hypothetical protein [Ferrimonas marina]SHH60342.1 hypothetical protein SAMN02745129_2489 [Ferrimonas marina]
MFKGLHLYPQAAMSDAITDVLLRLSMPDTEDGLNITPERMTAFLDSEKGQPYREMLTNPPGIDVSAPTKFFLIALCTDDENAMGPTGVDLYLETLRIITRADGNPNWDLLRFAQAFPRGFPDQAHMEQALADYRCASSGANNQQGALQ